MTAKNMNTMTSTIQGSMERIGKMTDDACKQVLELEEQTKDRMHKVQTGCADWKKALNNFDDMWNQGSNNPPADQKIDTKAEAANPTKQG
jgi:hypothetical protein